jgi:peptide/nickel transport system ATP-binding protein
MTRGLTEQATASTLLEVDDLTITFAGNAGRPVTAVRNVSLAILEREVVGLVGESGSGKSSLALGIANLLARNASLEGTVTFEGTEVRNMPRARLRHLWGREIGTVFQDPTAALNPVLTIGAHIDETLKAHTDFSRDQRERRIVELLEMVGMPHPKRRMKSYMHELSGGMRQRAVIATAIACGPKLLIADEPTTALDVTIQEQILNLLLRLRDELRMAVLFVSHDLGVINYVADRVHVMYGGRIVEQGRTRDVLTEPIHHYTAALIGAVPAIAGNRTARLVAIPGSPPDPRETTDLCPFVPRCPAASEICSTTPAPRVGQQTNHTAFCHHPNLLNRPSPRDDEESGDPGRVGFGRGGGGAETEAIVTLENLSVVYGGGGSVFRADRTVVRAVDDVSLEFYAGQTLGLVGESGCGKSTLGRAILRIVPAQSGVIRFRGLDIGRLSRRALRRQRSAMQMVFQNPYASLDPRMSVGDALAEPLSIHHRGSRRQQRERARELLSQVHLPPEAASRYPHELSGGQQQRVAIARALAPDPAFLICDEPTSSLDVSIQAQITNLLLELQERLGLSYLFISHNLAVVRQLAQRIAIMYLGQVVEIGDAATVIESPMHPYTKLLLSSVTAEVSESPKQYTSTSSSKGEAIQIPGALAGCPFQARCPYVQDRCLAERPLLVERGGRRVACHFAERIARGELSPRTSDTALRVPA